MIEARTGQPVSSDSDEAVTLYQDAVDRILGSESGAVDALDRAIELDEEFALASAARTIEATYEFPYLSHAPMEPLNCTIEKIDDRYVLRSGTQMPSVDQQRVAEFFGVPQPVFPAL